MKTWNVRQEDINAYLKVCKDAVENDEVFAVFKSLPAYRKILEHTSMELGRRYFNSVYYDFPHWFSEAPFLDNDKFGHPLRYKYISPDGVITASPTTLQYVYVLARLIELCGSLDRKKIVEIGGGYGGQCKIIHDCFIPHSYDIVDLVGVDKLQQKYLMKFGIEVLTWPGCWPRDYLYDLVISNYALSEVTEPTQTKYVRDILLNCSHGYLTCNGPIHAMQEIKDKFPTFKISPDIEGERKENFIITW